MRDLPLAHPLADPLALWRGVDDAVWREAARNSPPVRVVLPRATPTAAPMALHMAKLSRLEPA